jgi:crotonobetainyl-CoA:carnitine CoA-transferase CaiB-like acyl-CoA transferase
MTGECVPSSLSQPEAQRLPLTGLRVVELIDKAEMCGRYLADLGADVVRVEPPAGSTRRRHGSVLNGHSVSFAVRNVNKRSAVADLHTHAGRRELLGLLEVADLWIESTRPGTLAHWGIDCQQVRQRNPRLVILSITDFGQTGPYRDYVATPAVHAAMAGVLCRSGSPGREPLVPPSDIPVEAAYCQAAWAALLGVWNAIATGAGDHIDFSIYEATGQVMDPAMGMTGTAMADTPQAVSWMAPGRPTTQPYPIYQCADGHVRVVLLAARQWQAMGDWLGNPSSYPTYGNISTRAAIIAQVEPLIVSLVKRKTMTDLVDEGQKRGIPIAPVLGLSDVLSSEHYQGRGAIVRTEIAPGLTATVPNGFVTIDGAMTGIRSPAPELGDDTGRTRQRWADRAPERFAEAIDPGAGIRRPLTGVRVLDLGVIVYGAELGRLFADQGAEVIKVENRDFPDGARISLGTEMNANFAAGNRGKQSIGVNLRTPEGVDIVKRLVEVSDVVLANFKPGTLESLGLGFDVMRNANPRIVFVQGSAMGSTGPWRGWLGYGPVVRCAAGLTSLWRYSEDSDFFGDNTTIYPDNLCARVMAVAGLAALIRARSSGLSAHVDGSQAEMILPEIAVALAHESLQPGSGFNAAAGTAGDATSDVLPCAGDDQWCVVSVRADEDWARVCAVMDSAMADDPRLATSAGRREHADVVHDRMVAWTSMRTPSEVETTLQGAGVPAGRMQRVSEFHTDPHFAARNYLATYIQPEVGPITVETGPFLSERMPPPDLRPAPKLGEHTRHVMTTILGMTEDDVTDLVVRGVLEENRVLVSDLEGQRQ